MTYEETRQALWYQIWDRLNALVNLETLEDRKETTQKLLSWVDIFDQEEE